MPTPLLIFSDAVTASSGLARITRDLALRIAKMLEFKVGTIGYGGPVDARLPFQQYSWNFDGSWEIKELPEVWDDFAGQEKGIFLTIQDASRMLWLARPETECSDLRLRTWLRKKPFQKWGYFPIDATGVNDKFTYCLEQTYLGYDRVLAYTQWAKSILLNTLGEPEAKQRDLHYLPHGLDTSVWYPRDKKQAKAKFFREGTFSVNQGDLLIGIVGTNQPRKDFGLGISVAAELAKHHPVKLWIHTDVLERHWSIPALLRDFGLIENSFVDTATFPDAVMAFAYSACDVTLGIGNAEGFGYPIFESLACGTPCVHGNYGGAPEFMPRSMLVEAFANRIEGPYNCVRMVYRVEDFVAKVISVIGLQRPARLPQELEWDNLWCRWRGWLERGLASAESKS